MFLIIIDNDKQIKTVLEKNPYCYKGIRVSFNIEYYLELDETFYINDYKDKKVILENKHYEILNDESLYPIHLFVFENNEGINDFKLYENSNFVLTNNENTNIINNNYYLNYYYLSLKKGLIKTNSNYLYVNSIKENQKVLNDGDLIEYLGFTMYYYKDFLYINNFLINNKLRIKNVEEINFQYKDDSKLIYQRFREPVVNLNIEELKELELPKDRNNKSLFLQIGPSLTMSFAMLSIAIINVYNNRLNGGSNISSLVFLMMPITMLLSGVMWPLISSKNETNKYQESYDVVKNNYLTYLNNYKNRQIKNINLYRKRLTSDVLNLKDFSSRIFTYNINNPAFLKLFIGYYDIENSYVVNKVGDKEIDHELNEIEKIINKITNIPLFINLNEINNLTVISNSKYKDYYFKLYLLELCYKHHYKDVVVAIYKKDVSNIYNLPHLFINNMRCSLNNERQIQELNAIKINKPIILFLYDKPEFKINNPLIKCIYFSDNENNILNDSDTVIKYYSSNGYLINSNKTKFNYFHIDYDYDYYFSLIEKYQNINLIPTVYNFKDREHNYLLKENYLNKQVSLKADFAYVGSELLSFDLHETKEGPHGLIGGATGSGKSELIISFILSLCIKYRPDYVNIILIDYKGEGIKDSLSYKDTVVPHIVANISNLEEDAFERLIIKIRNECKKRQMLFNKLSSLTSLSIVNIDDYLENNSELEKIAHLIIVVDEFAELKKEYPELMKELVSLSRIGRSLGVHLVLSTQRPSGVIDDEIWSNSHFKIALKVHSEKDSQDLIKTKDAAYLTSPGEFYLQVDDSTLKARSIYSKNDISGKEKIEVALLDNRLSIEKKLTINNPNPLIESNQIVNNIIDVCEELKIGRHVLDFEKPESKSLKDLTQKYEVKNNDLVLGEIDDYLNGQKDILKVNNKENILIYSTRENEIDNILNSLVSDFRKIIVISNKKYTNPYIIESFIYEDEDDINFLFNSLIDYHGDQITLIIEDYSCFVSYNDNYQEKIYRLLQRNEMISLNLIIISKKSTFNFKILNSINDKFVIKIFDNQDLLNIYCSQSKYKGDSFFKGDNLISFIPVKQSTFNNIEECKNEFIRKVPIKLDYFYKNSYLLIGFSKKERKEIYLSDNDKLLITTLSNDKVDIYNKIFINNLNVDVNLYDSKIQTSKYKHIIWLGGNRDRQNIFYDDLKVDLKDDEGIYIKEGKKEIIKVINYE